MSPIGISCHFVLPSALIALLFLSVSTLEPAPNTVRFVIALYRHGVRTPTSPHPGDPNSVKYSALGRPGDLTDVGKRQMYAVGLALKGRYGSFVNGYHKSKVLVSSTTSSRTVVSAHSVMAGLFPSNPRIFRKFPWQPIPVTQDTQYMDKSFLLNLVFQRELLMLFCPRYAKLIERPLYANTKPDARPENKALYDHVKKHTGDQSINKPYQLFGFYDSFYFAERNGIELPSWATDCQKQFKGSALYPDLMSSFKREYLDTLMYYEKNKEMLDIFAGPMLYHISSILLDKGAKLNSSPKVNFHFTHDTALYALLRALEIDDPLTGDPGDGVVIELHLENNLKIVKIFFHIASTNSLQELTSPLCPSPCTLARFLNKFRGISSRQWKLNCEL